MDTDDFSATPPMQDHGPAVWMALTYFALFFLLTAFSAPGRAQAQVARAAPASDARSSIVVRIETLKVVPQPEDLPAPVKARWQRFDEALNAGRSSRNYRTVEWRDNDGVRTACYEPCVNNCCTSSRAPSVVFGQGFGR